MPCVRRKRNNPNETDMNYKCIMGFTTAKGKSYHYGNRINYSEYRELNPDEQRKFMEEIDSSSSSSNSYSTSPDYSSMNLPDYGPSGFDSGSSSGSDFGGGDFGGGGAGGDY